MTNQTTIRGDGGVLSLHILGRENPEARNSHDLDWLRASISVTAGRFSGTTDLGLTSSELVLLRDQLESALRSLKGGVHFATMEGNWTLDIRIEITGALIITGSLTANPAVANTLNYEFWSDPISLEAVARDIRRISDAYPPPTAERL